MSFPRMCLASFSLCFAADKRYHAPSAAIRDLFIPTNLTAHLAFHLNHPLMPYLLIFTFRCVKEEKVSLFLSAAGKEGV